MYGVQPQEDIVVLGNLSVRDQLRQTLTYLELVDEDCDGIELVVLVLPLHAGGVYGDGACLELIK